jgi:hypothetical protein
MLECKKIYIDTRFKTPESRSDADFFVELPSTVNIPENCVCYIDDIVIPMSWNTVDARNNKLYVRIDYLLGTARHAFYLIQLPIKNYSNVQYAAALEFSLNASAFVSPLAKFSVSVDVDNILKITQLDSFEIMKLTIIPDEHLLSGGHWHTKLSQWEICSMNGILRIDKTLVLTKEAPSYSAYIDLHATRNLYLTSSSMASYNTMSNFKNDVIIKKIPVRANYGQMIFDGASNGYDYLQLSKRTLRRLDFRLEDSYGNVMNLNGNHWSFSLIFQLQ